LRNVAFLKKVKNVLSAQSPLNEFLPDVAFGRQKASESNKGQDN
jgi:hypothetical protein